MMDEYGFYFAGIDEATIRREKAKAREIRKSQWWKNKVGLGVCYYCSKSVLPSGLTMDHIVPLARGGRSVKANLVVCCKSCNNKKKTLLPLEWEEYLENLDQQKE